MLRLERYRAPRRWPLWRILLALGFGLLGFLFVLVLMGLAQPP